MAVTTFGKKAPIWHAYNALDENKKQDVGKSQLKVFTHNLLSSIGIQIVGSQTYEEDYQAHPKCMTFAEYLSFLMNNILFKHLNSADIENDNTLLEKIDEVCWLVCAKTYIIKNDKSALTENSTYKLWRVFNVLAQVDDDEETVCPVSMEWEEVEVLLQKLHKVITTEFKKAEFRQFTESHKFFNFPELVELLETKHFLRINPEVVAGAIGELYEENILGVIKNGYLSKKGGLLNPWVECWSVLTPSMFRYYGKRDEKELRGIMAITRKCSIENVTDKSNMKQKRFIIKSDDKKIEFSVSDTITKMEWITAFETAIQIQNSNHKDTLSKAEIKQRRISRLARREKLSQEKLRQLKDEEERVAAEFELQQERKKTEESNAKLLQAKEMQLHNEDLMKKTREELEEERKHKAEIESKLLDQLNDQRYLQARFQELEEMHKQSLLLLEKEKKAKEEEELCRIRQATIIQEELQKKEELKQMHAALESLLRNEQQKRVNLEELRQEQEALLQEGVTRLEQLETERKQRDLDYKIALETLQKAEEEKKEMERKLQKRKETPFGQALEKFSQCTEPGKIVSHRDRGFCALVKAEYEKKALELAIPSEDISLETIDKMSALNLSSERNEELYDNVTYGVNTDSTTENDKYFAEVIYSN